jgi:hypothetical protein
MSDFEETNKKICRALLEKHGKISSSLVQLKCRVSFHYAKILIAQIHQERAIERWKDKISSCEKEGVLIGQK